VRDLIDTAFSHIGIEDWSRYVVHDSLENRPVDPGNLVGDSSNARHRLGWNPETPIKEVIRMMVDSDIKLLKTERA
jgi:GDPmannose 4,6-dehydratase